jgi:hypothetical protein
MGQDRPMTMTSPADRIAQLEHCVREQMKEIDRLRALISRKDAELDEMVAWVASDADSLAVLRGIYADPRQSPANKIRACASAIAYERSRPASVAVVVDFRAKVRAARVAALERDKAKWQLEDASKTIIEGSILGSDNSAEEADPGPAA